MVYRKDNFKFNDYKVTENGFIVISGIVTRNGIFKYDDGNELRPYDEVFKKDSLETMFANPVTFEHPPDLLSFETIPMYQKGIVASQPTIEKLDDNISVVRLDSIIVQDKSLIHEIIENGLREFSLGYTCDLEEKEGKFDGSDYIRVQKNIKYNHLAIVRDARCGKVCSITSKGDSMANGYKVDCACQKVTKTDADKDEGKKEMKSEEKKAEDKKDEGEEGKWEKMFAQHERMISLLEKLAGAEDKEDKKDEAKDKEEEPKKDGDKEKDFYDEDEDEMKMKKDKKRKDAINNFSYKVDSKSNDNSDDFEIYTRESYEAKLRKGSK